nr:MAG TPA: terminase RNaseH-like domain protein [Caudoviricetes sp.]
MDCIREFGAYRWDEKAAEDQLLKTDGHAMDDTRYFIRTMFSWQVQLLRTALHLTFFVKIFVSTQ